MGKSAELTYFLLSAPYHRTILNWQQFRTSALLYGNDGETQLPNRSDDHHLITNLVS